MSQLCFINKFKGEILTISSLALWGLSPIITKFTYNYIDFKMSLALSSFFAFLYFLVLFIKNKDYTYLKETDGWKNLFISSILNGVIFYLIIFYGLQYTSSTNSSIFGLMEIFFSFLLFGFLFGKRETKSNEVIGAIMMVIGALVVLFPGTLKFNYGDIFIIIASIISPIGNHYAKKTIKYFPSRFLMLIRSLIATIFLFLYIYITNQFIFIYSDFIIVLPYLIFSGIILFGLSKTLWIDAFKYISIPRASIFLTLYPIFTIIYNIIIFLELPSLYQVLGLIPIIFGIYFIFGKSTN